MGITDPLRYTIDHGIIDTIRYNMGHYKIRIWPLLFLHNTCTWHRGAVPVILDISLLSLLLKCFHYCFYLSVFISCRIIHLFLLRANNLKSCEDRLVLNEVSDNSIFHRTPDPPNSQSSIHCHSRPCPTLPSNYIFKHPCSPFLLLSSPRTSVVQSACNLLPGRL